MPEGWEAPARRDENSQYLTDGTARIFVYSGDAAYFAEDWGIPEDTSALPEAAESLAARVGGTVGESPLANALPIVLLPGGGMQSIIYLAQDSPWVLVSAIAPVDEFDAYRADVFEPLVQSIGDAEADVPMPVPAGETTPTPLPVKPSVTPTPVEASATPIPAKPSATPLPVEATATPAPQPVTFESYSNKAIGLALDIPTGWVEYTDPSMVLPEMGVMAVFFFSNPADAGSVEDTPTDPALFLMRIGTNSLDFLEVANIKTPAELLFQAFGQESDEVKPFTLEDYPAARALIRGDTEDDEDGIIYALDLGEDGWLVGGLVVPAGYNVLLLDETVMMPVMRSVQVIGPVSTDAGDVEITLTPTPTLRP